MEEQLSLLDLVLHASITVQLVMVVLLGASMASWYMIIQRFIYYRNATDEREQGEEKVGSGSTQEIRCPPTRGKISRRSPHILAMGLPQRARL